MKKKIMFVSNFARNLLAFRLELMLELTKKFQVIACAPLDREFDKVADLLASYGIKLIPVKLNRVGKNLLADFNYTFQLFRLFKKERPHIVFSAMIKPIIYGSIAAKLSGRKEIYSEICGLGYVFINNTWQVKILRYIVKKLYTLALYCNQKVFFLNPDDLNLFVNNKIVAKDKTCLVNGSGVNIDKYSVKALPKEYIFLFMGRLIKDKGIYEYIEAAKIIKKQFPRVKFKLLGGYDQNPASLTENELDSIIASEVIEYLGVLEDVRPALENCSVFVLPSYREGIPRSVLEAMAMGRPIITTDAPGCRETVTDGVNGYLVPIKNVTKLAEAMEKFIVQPELISLMGQRSRQLVEEKYDVHKVNSAILSKMEL